MKCMAKTKGFFGGILLEPGQFFEAKECPTWAVEVESEQVGVKPIREALLSLRTDDDAQWTKTGLPKLDVLEDILGYPVTRKEINESYPGFERTMMQHGDKLDDGTVAGA